MIEVEALQKKFQLVVLKRTIVFEIRNQFLGKKGYVFYGKVRNETRNKKKKKKFRRLSFERFFDRVHTS